jgi:hypothetical protein
MIHKLFVIDRNKSIGVSLYIADGNQLQIETELLIGLVQALMLLGEEMGPTKGGLREAELGKYQIGIMSKDHLAYVIIQDAYDSEPFTSRMLEGVINKFHDEFLKFSFRTDLPKSSPIRAEISKMLQTMKFPKQYLPKVKIAVDRFHKMTTAITDTLFIADLDDGIVSIITQPTKDENIIKLLMEILSEIPFDRHWIGESKLRNPKIIDGIEKTHEGWVIYRINDTDFCIMGRTYFNHGAEHDSLILSLESLTEEVARIII